MPQLPFSFRNLSRSPAEDTPVERAEVERAEVDRPEARGPEGSDAPARAAEAPGPSRPPPPAPPQPKRPMPKPPPESRVLSVTEVQRILRQHLEAEFGTISVRGEVSNLRVQSSGHAYFTLKDRRAQLNCVLFATERARLRFRLADGLSVVASGRVTIYDRSGSLQLRVLRCEPEGQGALWAQFQERARKMRAEGLTDPARKRPLPVHPVRVGIVTSRTGAALRDVVRTLIRRDPSVRIRIGHAQVQGARAAGDIVAAIRRLDRFGDCDVLIVARGGGSIEDLWAFNEEPVARAIVASSVPVIVGVGHETDLTIADMVADRSASTPTAAAAAAVPDRSETIERLQALADRLERAARHHLQHRVHRVQRLAADLHLARPPVHRWAQQLDQLQHRAHAAVAARLRTEQGALRGHHDRLAAAAPAVRLARARAELERMPGRLHHAMQAALTAARARHADHERRLTPAVEARLDAAHRRWEAGSARLEALSPLAVLQRGYALVRTADGRVVRDATAVDDGDEIEVRVASGAFGARVIRPPMPSPPPPAGTGPIPPKTSDDD